MKRGFVFERFHERLRLRERCWFTELRVELELEKAPAPEGGRYKGESNPRGRGEPRPYRGLLKTAGWTGYGKGHFWICYPPLSFRLNLRKQAKDSTPRLLSWV
jgi:hypothetical protein